MTRFVGIFETPGGGGAIAGLSTAGTDHGLIGRSVHAVDELGGVFQLCEQHRKGFGVRLVWVRVAEDWNGPKTAHLMPDGKLHVQVSQGGEEA